LSRSLGIKDAETLREITILYHETRPQRHYAFWITDSKGSSVAIKHTYTPREFDRQLQLTGKIDYIFLPDIWWDGGLVRHDLTLMGAVDTIIQKDQKPELVIFQGEQDNQGIIKRLLRVGIPAIHIPYGQKKRQKAQAN
jgi:hypothetical protein